MGSIGSRYLLVYLFAALQEIAPKFDDLKKPDTNLSLTSGQALVCKWEFRLNE